MLLALENPYIYPFIVPSLTDNVNLNILIPILASQNIPYSLYGSLLKLAVIA